MPLELLQIRPKFLICILIFYILFTLLYFCFVWIDFSSFKFQEAPILEDDQLDPKLYKYDLSKLEENDLYTRVNELIDIRTSVLRELKQFEQNRSKILKEISQLNTDLETLKNQRIKRNNELEQLQTYMKQALLTKQEIKDRPELFAHAPLNLLPKYENTIINELSFNSNHKRSISYDCKMFNCFDYSKCSIFSSFQIFIYNLNEEKLLTNDGPESMFNTMIYKQLKKNAHVTINPNSACLYVIFIPHNFKILGDLERFKSFIYNLPYWNGDGRNHLILNADKRDLKRLGLNFGKAIIAQTEYTLQTFNQNYDLIISNFNSDLKNFSLNHESFNPKILPARRKYFLSCLSYVPNSIKQVTFANIISDELLKLISRSSIVGHNEFLFDFHCDDKTKSICDNQTIILIESTFNIIFPEQFKVISSIDDDTLIHDEEFCFKMFRSIKSGTIPIIIGGELIKLPFEDVIDWNRALIRLPIARISELYVVLKTFTDSDIIAMRTFGYQIYRNYFSTTEKMLNLIFAYFRAQRLQIPALPIKEENTSYYFNTGKYSMMQFNATNAYLRNKIYADYEEMVGPLEAPFESERFIRNYSVLLTDSYRIWNDPHNSPFFNFPSLTNDPLLPTDAKFFGSSYGFRPIGNGLGGSGKEFSQSIGGNFVREQFTIVILTYERESILLAMLAKFKDLPYLNKVIVVWNSPRPPSEDIIWPDIGVDIVVVKVEKNSLNNRFLPFSEIKTDAILSLDDDSNFRNDEIVFGFRVWRESRDKIVGFPARGHSWNGESWNYNSNHTCEFSMILTGGAFFHKYYSYLYSYVMPQQIRDKVDELMNCEDIAMNFLVAHVTRQPPVKVTSKWTFRNPTLSNNLSGATSHYINRGQCINYFSEIYGYMPLLYTQFRADSVLYKTRIPQGHQKCFRQI